MVPAGKVQDRERALWWFQVKLWSGAGICIALLSACFTASCWVTYLTYARLSEVHMSSNPTFSEGTGVTVKNRNCSCCPKSWKSFGSNCYFISPEDKSKEDSEKICSAMQTHLLVVTSQEEQDFIIRNLDRKFDYYIGLSDIGTKGIRKWQWVDQTPYNESATFWTPGEPNFDDERCVVLHFHKGKRIWGWNDVVCTLHHKSICQMTEIHLSLEHSP